MLFGKIVKVVSKIRLIGCLLVECPQIVYFDLILLCRRYACDTMLVVVVEGLFSVGLLISISPQVSSQFS